MYFSFNLLNFCDLLPQLINHFAGRLGNADLLAVLYLEADSCGLAILHVHHVGNMNRSLLVNDARRSDWPWKVWSCLGNHVHALYEHCAVLRIDSDYLALFILICSGDHSYGVALLNLQC